MPVQRALAGMLKYFFKHIYKSMIENKGWEMWNEKNIVGDNTSFMF